MPRTVAQKLIADHLVEGEMAPGQEIGLRIDQTLTQDATGTLVMLELEAMELERVQTELSAQYVDHNLLQEDFKNPDDHRFLESACRKFGIWYSRPGNGVSHPLHQERFGKPGRSLLGSDSHTCAAGAIGMLAMGAGGIEVATAMVGYPFFVKMPRIWGVKLVGELQPWVSAKDIILELLRRHSVDGGLGRIVEYYGPGLAGLTAMDRHVIANMGAELGATTTVFPSDGATREFLESQGREEDWIELAADYDAQYDDHDQIDLGQVEPLIAMPSSPGNVRPVREVVGEPIQQAYIGSSANPGYRDFAIAAEMVAERPACRGVSFDVNPTSRQILENLIRDGHLQALVHGGARLHQAGCNGCIGMGQAPATDTISLRTVPRNFPGRSGTREDKVCLVSPETATASAIGGAITDPRTLDLPAPHAREPGAPLINSEMFQPPLEPTESSRVELVKGPNIVSIPRLEALPDTLELPILLKLGDDVSTDEILPPGARVLPLRSNIPEISKFSFEVFDNRYHQRAIDARTSGGHALIAGENYGQGSSREHAALAPRFLGLRVVIAKTYARIHWQNLICFGVLPLRFANDDDYERLEQGDTLRFQDLRNMVRSERPTARRVRDSSIVDLRHDLSKRQQDIVLKGGIINHVRQLRSQ